VMVSTVWSVSCLLFYSRGAPPVPHGVGATASLGDNIVSSLLSDLYMFVNCQ